MQPKSHNLHDQEQQHVDLIHQRFPWADASQAGAVLTSEEVLGNIVPLFQRLKAHKVGESQLSSKWARIWKSVDGLVCRGPLVVGLSNTRQTEEKKACIGPSWHLFGSRQQNKSTNLSTSSNPVLIMAANPPSIITGSKEDCIMVVSRKHQSTEFSSPPILTLGWPQAPCQVVLWQQHHRHDRGRAGQDHLPWQHRVVQDEEAGSGPSLDQHRPGQVVPNQAQHQLHHSQDKKQASLSVFSEIEIWHDNSRLTFTLITMWATPGTLAWA